MFPSISTHRLSFLSIAAVASLWMAATPVGAQTQTAQPTPSPTPGTTTVQPGTATTADDDDGEGFWSFFGKEPQKQQRDRPDNDRGGNNKGH